MRSPSSVFCFANSRSAGIVRAAAGKTRIPQKNAYSSAGSCVDSHSKHKRINYGRIGKALAGLQRGGSRAPGSWKNFAQNLEKRGLGRGTRVNRKRVSGVGFRWSCPIQLGSNQIKSKSKSWRPWKTRNPDLEDQSLHSKGNILLATANPETAATANKVLNCIARDKR